MRFTPRTEEEIKATDLLPKGVYDFTVLEAQDAISERKGNEMIKLKLEVFDKAGRGKWVWDYLVSSDAGLCIRKLRHFAATVGMLSEYESGKLDAAALVGRSGKVEIEIEDDGVYDPKNSVSDYVVPEGYVSAKDAQAAVSLAREAANSPGPGPDEIPF